MQNLDCFQCGRTMLKEIKEGSYLISSLCRYCSKQYNVVMENNSKAPADEDQCYCEWVNNDIPTPLCPDCFDHSEKNKPSF
jgi:hypothetical protein